MHDYDIAIEVHPEVTMHYISTKEYDPSPSASRYAMLPQWAKVGVVKLHARGEVDAKSERFRLINFSMEETTSQHTRTNPWKIRPLGESKTDQSKLPGVIELIHGEKTFQRVQETRFVSTQSSSYQIENYYLLPNVDRTISLRSPGKTCRNFANTDVTEYANYHTVLGERLLLPKVLTQVSLALKQHMKRQKSSSAPKKEEKEEKAAPGGKKGSNQGDAPGKKKVCATCVCWCVNTKLGGLGLRCRRGKSWETKTIMDW